MNYMLLIYLDEDRPKRSVVEDDETMRGCGGLAERLMAQGKYRGAGILQPTACATSIRLREGRRVVTDGPFAETHEQLAGYMVVEAADLDEAIAIASQHPVATYGTVEVRPILHIPSYLPPDPAEAALSASN